MNNASLLQGQLGQLIGQQAQCSNQQRPNPASDIRNRLAELEKVRENYRGYLRMRMSESDWHGCWDASVNISETECEMAGLKFALAAIEGT